MSAFSGMGGVYGGEGYVEFHWCMFVCICEYMPAAVCVCGYKSQGMCPLSTAAVLLLLNGNGFLGQSEGDTFLTHLLLMACPPQAKIEQS